MRLVVLFLIATIGVALHLGRPTKAFGARLCSECAAGWPWPGTTCPPASLIGSTQYSSCMTCWRSCVLDYSPIFPNHDGCGDVQNLFMASDWSCLDNRSTYGYEFPTVCNDSTSCSGGRLCSVNQCTCTNQSNGSDPEHYDPTKGWVKDPCPPN